MKLTVAETKALPRAMQYEEMIRDLFTKDLGGIDGQRMHAAIGISGESAELMKAFMLRDERNLVEEGGDAYFYVQALLNQNNWTVEDVLNARTDCEQDLVGMEGAQTIIYAGDILDIAKKSWVYGKTIDLAALKTAVGNWLHAFMSLMDAEGGDFFEALTLEDLKAHNQYKLVTGPNARFATGKYTDAAAIARADKPAGE